MYTRYEIAMFLFCILHLLGYFTIVITHLIQWTVVLLSVQHTINHLTEFSFCSVKSWITKLRNTEHRLCKWQTKTKCPSSLMRANSVYVKSERHYFYPHFMKRVQITKCSVANSVSCNLLICWVNSLLCSGITHVWWIHKCWTYSLYYLSGSTSL